MAVEGVYKYLQSTNRPYSANDIVQNMHKEFGKTAVQKALDDLVAQRRIFEKVYGKQKIYCVKQPEDDNVQDNDLSLLESEVLAMINQMLLERLLFFCSLYNQLIEGLQNKIIAKTEKVTQNFKNVEQEAKEAEAKLRELLAAPTTAEAREQLANTEKKVEALRAKLAKLSENTVLVSPAERTKIKAEHEKMLKEYRKRKRLCMDVINAIMEGYPKSKQALMEEVGVETDEDVKMPTIQTN